MTYCREWPVLQDEQEDRTSSELAASDRAPAADKVDDAKSSEKLPEEGDNDAGTDDNKEDEGSGEDGKADAEENGDEETGTEHTEDLKQDDDDNMNTAQGESTFFLKCNTYCHTLTNCVCMFVQ